jgi:hypothetical protein
MSKKRLIFAFEKKTEKVPFHRLKKLWDSALNKIKKDKIINHQNQKTQ